MHTLLEVLDYRVFGSIEVGRRRRNTRRPSSEGSTN